MEPPIGKGGKVDVNLENVNPKNLVPSANFKTECDHKKGSE